MMNKTVDLIQMILDDNRRVAALIVGCFALFPFFIIAFLFAAQAGKVPNVYQTEHAQIRALVESQQNLAQKTLDTHIHLRDELITNRGLINEGAYYQQRTCVNTAKTEELREECIKPKWQRKMNDQ